MSKGVSAGCEQLIPTTAMKNRDVGAAVHFRSQEAMRQARLDHMSA
jgi:hypothetical protein